MASPTDGSLSPDVRRFLETGTRTGKLGWVASDGRPLVAPVWFVLEDGVVVFNTGAGTAKGKAMARDPRVVLTVDLQEPPYAFVQIQGVAEISADPDDVLTTATAIGGRYMGQDRAKEFGRRNGVPGEVAVRIRATKVIADLNVTA